MDGSEFFRICTLLAFSWSHDGNHFEKVRVCALFSMNRTIGVHDACGGSDVVVSGAGAGVLDAGAVGWRVDGW